MSGRLRGARGVLALFAGVVVLTAAIALVGAPLVPDPRSRALAAIAAVTVAAVAVRPWFGTWTELGLRWRGPHPWLLAVPAVVALLPLGFGLRIPDPATLGVLIAGYALTGFTEELVWRGMALRALAASRPLTAVLATSALFGLTHLVNLLLRDGAGLVVAQAWGAFCFGVGYAALRRRTGALVPLMALHAITDLAGALTAGPAIFFFVIQDAALLVFGLVLALREQRSA